MRGVLVGAVLIFTLMLVIKDGRASRNLGLTGSCQAITAPKGQDGAWFGCVAGKLEGARSHQARLQVDELRRQARALALPRRDNASHDT